MASPNSAIHAPFTLLPTPFPRKLFERAHWLQRMYDILYARVAMDTEFLDHVMGTEGVGAVDDFVASLWKGWKSLRDEGIVQPLQLGLFRSDYLLHQPSEHQQVLKQVEFNTISSSFGPLSDRVTALHRYLVQATDYYHATPLLSDSNIPPNDALGTLASGLAAAHHVYGVQQARILFVVQPGERNIFDQRWLEYELLEKHSIKVIRLTFAEVASHCSSQSSHILKAKLPSSDTTFEIAVVYYRAGYTPTDYPTPQQFETRVFLERTRAIKCPSINLQLAGSKKVQEVLTQPGVLESFLSNPIKWGNQDLFMEDDLREIRENWMGMWGLDIENGEGAARARKEAANLVLKPQREGGGNNIYKANIPAFLDKLPESELRVWIAMELMVPPDSRNVLVSAGSGVAVEKSVVSELGVFGWALFGVQGQPVEEKTGGWLVRTKGKESDEGGVAVGFSVLDSLVLTD
jgi:glutathione synthase